MKSIVAYVRSLLGWCEEDLPYSRTTFKRDRADDDFSSDDDTPALKRLKQLKKTNFPDMSANDLWDKREKNVRYIPIQLEHGHPSTSTPKDSSAKQGNKVRTVPIKFVDITANGSETPAPKPRIHTPVRPVIHAVIDDDDDDEEQEVTVVENKSANVKKPTKVYIELDDDDNEHHQQEDDVIFVKKVTTPSPVKPYKFFITKNNTDNANSRVNKYYTISQRISSRNTENILPRNHNKFKTPAGITKTYKKQAAPIMSWIQTAKPNLSPLRKKYLNVNGNARSTLTEVFNLDEKRNYQELIRRVAGTTKPVTLRKPVDIIDLAEESASFRSTRRTQKSALNEIKLVEEELKAHKETEESKEYDPITVASINSSDSEVEIVPSESSTTSSFRIDPVNSLRDSYKDRPVTSSDWLTKLDSKYRKKKQDTQDKLKDARLENDIIAKVNHEQKIAHLEHKLKYELSIPESLIVEAEPAAEFPELTPEQEKLVNRALGPGPPGQLLIEKFNLRIHRRDLQTLADLNWLNDEVINFYMNLLMQRSEQRKDLPRVYATNTFFYPKLMQAGQAGLRRWTRKVDIFSYELMIVPVHLGVHWCMSVIDFVEKRIKYFDSMGARNQACVEALLQYLRDEHKDKKGSAFDDSGWRTECVKDIPQQMNGSDCGMFALTFGEFSCRRAPFAFSQAHMPYLRRRAALELLSGQLLM